MPWAASAFGDRGLDLLLVGDVGDDRNALHLGRDLLGILLALIEHRDPGALGGHRTRGRGTEAGAAAGDENGNVFQLHDKSSPWAFPVVLKVFLLVLKPRGRHPDVATVSSVLVLSMPPQISASMCRMYWRQTSSVTGPTPVARDIACRAKNRWSQAPIRLV